MAVGNISFTRCIANLAKVHIECQLRILVQHIGQGSESLQPRGRDHHSTVAY